LQACYTGLQTAEFKELTAEFKELTAEFKECNSCNLCNHPYNIKTAGKEKAKTRLQHTKRNTTKHMNSPLCELLPNLTLIIKKL